MKERPELLARDNWPLAEAARAVKRLPAFFARHQIFLRRTGPFGSIGQARPVEQATATPIRGFWRAVTGTPDSRAGIQTPAPQKPGKARQSQAAPSL